MTCSGELNIHGSTFAPLAQDVCFGKLRHWWREP